MLEDVNALAKLIKPDQDNQAVFRALIAVLNNVPDSSIITAGLSQISVDDIESEELRTIASKLLVKADAPQLAKLWATKKNDETLSNIVSLNGHANSTSPRFATSITFDDIGGLEDVKKQVRRKIISPFQDKKAIFQRFKRKAGGGVLMYGPPGCGKTMLARALATECNATFREIRAADVLDQYVGIAEKHIVDVFLRARTKKPAVLFFDEVEALAQKRQFESNAKVNTVVSVLLTEMDGFSDDNEDILFLGATNVPWSLDPAFRRPGRFDRSIFVPPPDKVARAFILNGLLKERPMSHELSLDEVIEKSVGYSGADLAALVETAVDYAIEDSTSVDNLAPLSQEHFSEAFREVKSTVGEWLAQARGFAQYANESGLYDELAIFLKKYAK